MVSQAIKRGPSTSPTTQDAKAESKVNDELSDTMKQVCLFGKYSLGDPLKPFSFQVIF